MTEDTNPYRRSTLERVIGGTPLSVAVRLLVLSLVVGFLMSVFGLNAADLLNGAIELVQSAFADSAGLFRQMWVYVLTGAAVVVPIWVIIRITKAR